MLQTQSPVNILATQMAQNSSTSQAEAHGTSYSELHQKLLAKKAQIGVVGLGYVGLPLTMTFNKAGYSVIGFEKSPEKVDLLKDGLSYVKDVKNHEVKKYVESEHFVPTADFKALEKCDVIVICVPTPLAKSQGPDMSFIDSALESIGQYLHQGQLVILESTTYPGTTRELVMPRLQEAGEKRSGKEFQCGRDFFVGFSPERVDPGNSTYTTHNTPKVVGGITQACGELAAVFYSQAIEKVIRVSSPESAEMVKLLENTFRAVNIGLVNEVAIMCEKLGVDCWEVIEAAATKPFGFMPFYPGPGLGGHCIPIDPSYLSWKLRTLNYTARFIDLANSINRGMPEFCAEKVSQALNADRKAVNGSRVLIVGVAYKKDVDDVRESPALDIIHELSKRGAEVDYYDPFVAELSYESQTLKSQAWSETLGAAYDCVLIATDHSEINYEALLRSSKRIVDTRNALRAFRSEKIHKL